MLRLFAYLPWSDPQPNQDQRIHLGNGQFLAAEDVLEGHFHRIALTTVPVQVRPDLTAAITILAPGLTPLTELAEEVAHTVPLVQPTAQFRHDLHKALEQTHRQHAAQRILGTRPRATSEHSSWAVFVLLLMVAVTVLGALTYWQKRQRMATA